MSRRIKGNVVGEIEEDEDSDFDYEKKKKKKSRVLFDGCKRAKKLVLSPFHKVYTRFTHHHHTGACSVDTESHTIPPKVGKFNCCLCFANPKTLEIDEHGNGNDPDELYVSYQSIKGLIENNDFYSEECNTHFPD